MSETINRNTWQTHYKRDRSRLGFPDENVVRFFEKFKRNHSIDNLLVLDHGCGSGRHLAYLRESGYKAVGVDYSFEAATMNKKTVVSYAEELGFRDNSFDIVLSWGVLHYLSRKKIENAINEIYRLLKPGGTFIGTLRADSDTQLKVAQNKGDLQGGTAQFFSKEQALEKFELFDSLQYGYICRIPVGEQVMVAHHIIQAVKP